MERRETQRADTKRDEGKTVKERKKDMGERERKKVKEDRQTERDRKSIRER